MAVGTSQLPSVMISNRDGVAIKAALAAAESTAEIAFGDTLPFLIDANGISDFSSRGPGADGSIRPDLVAVGEELLTAAQKNNPNGEIYDASGYAAQYGTSFASPLVAGAYAVLKAGRPGLTSSQYRSLLVNTAEPFLVAPVQEAGAGRLDVHAALRGRLAMEPVSVSFGTGGQRMDVTRPIRVQNVTPNTGTWKVEVASSDDVKATVEPAEFSLGSGDVIDLQVRLSGDLPVGENQGFLLFRPLDAAENERPQRMAYWYGVPSGKPVAATVIPAAPETAAAGATVTLTVLITDAIGAATPFEAPKVTVLEGGGEFIAATSIDEFYPGYWQVRLRIGPATGQRNRFRIEAGAAIREVSIQSR
jgi:subtilisin family serine protease